MAKTSVRLTVHQGLTRRDVLRGASAGVATSLAGSVLTGCGRPQEAAGTSAQGPPTPTLTPADMPEKWSVAEIERRWQVTRERMKEERFDCLLVPQHRPGSMVMERLDGDMDVEWLTGNSLPFKFVVLPYEGTVTAISGGKIRNTPEEKWTEERGIEVRMPEAGLWSQAIIDCLREKGMTRARIGVGNLVDAIRQPEGEISYTTYDRVLKALPGATFVPAGDLLWQVKLAHSPEEVAVFEKSVAVGEVGLQALMETARPGMPQRVGWLAMFNAMVNASGERPFRLSIAAGAGGSSTVNRPVEDVMQAGQILCQECTGMVLGHGTQVNHSMLLGSPAPEDWESAGQYCLDSFHAVVDGIAPGKTIGECALVNSQRMKAIGQGGGGRLFHSAELRVGSSGAGTEVVLEPGMVFDIKPSLQLKDGQSVQFGDSVVVTADGARRLGKREMKLITLGA